VVSSPPVTEETGATGREIESRQEKERRRKKQHGEPLSLSIKVVKMRK
jgi:hypothetical protein